MAVGWAPLPKRSDRGWPSHGGRSTGSPARSTMRARSGAIRLGSTPPFSARQLAVGLAEEREARAASRSRSSRRSASAWPILSRAALKLSAASPIWSTASLREPREERHRHAADQDHHQEGQDGDRAAALGLAARDLRRHRALDGPRRGKRSVTRSTMLPRPAGDAADHVAAAARERRAVAPATGVRQARPGCRRRARRRRRPAAPLGLTMVVAAADELARLDDQHGVRALAAGRDERWWRCSTADWGWSVTTAFLSSSVPTASVRRCGHQERPSRRWRARRARRPP